MQEDKTVQEVAKAVAATAQFGTQGIKTTEKILGFAAKVFKEPAEQTAGIINDRLKLFRWQRQIRYVDRVNQILAERGIKDTVAVPPKFALPILEGASLEDEDELQDLWARLIATALDPRAEVSMRMAFIEIIKSLNATDIKILKFFYDVIQSDTRVKREIILDYRLNKQQICDALNLDSHTYEVSIFNLFRAQCLAPALIPGGIQFGEETVVVYKGSQAVTMTPLGLDFVTSCIR